jgi:hypothetical protein
MKWLKDVLTEADNDTFCLVRVSALVVLAVAIGLEVFAIVERKQVFDFAAFAGGLTALYAGVGVAIKLKGDSNGNP